MTREEAIKWLEETVQDTDTYWESCSEALQKELDEQKEVFLMALSALRPVSREQVKKVWRGEWNNVNPAVLKPGVSWVCRCAKCGCPQDYKHNFCPACGAAQTDEAVQMVMERLEALKDGVD